MGHTIHITAISGLNSYFPDQMLVVTIILAKGGYFWLCLHQITFTNKIWLAKEKE